MNLCAKEIIPEDFHGYFSTLKTSKTAKDLIPVSISDEDTDSEWTNSDIIYAVRMIWFQTGLIIQPARNFCQVL